jgi:hypothetical protein
MPNKYLSKYSNGKTVSCAQYITELICEKMAQKDKKDLHYKFWLSAQWQQYYRNQIGSAHKLIKKYDGQAVIRALVNPKSAKIYSLRAPHLIPIIEEEQTKLATENTTLSLKIERKENIVFGEANKKSKSIISKLKDLE